MDVKGQRWCQRLFVCALGNDSIEVVDLKEGKRVRSIKGLSAPQGVAYIPESDRLVVANDTGGKVIVYQGRDFHPPSVIDLKDDADNVRYDAQSQRVYAGYGNGAVAILEASNAQLLHSLELPAHPESFQRETRGFRIFVNVPEAREVAVIDRRKSEVGHRRRICEFSNGPG